VDGRVAGAAITVNLTTGTGSGGSIGAGTTFSGFEMVLGSAFNDVLTANLDLGTDLIGLDGADTLNGANGDDLLVGDSFGGITVPGGADTLNGGGGDDRLEGGAFGDVLNGGAGVDTIVYQNSTAAVTINLALGIALGGEAQGDTFIDIENVDGSTYDDLLIGSAVANRLNGGNGDDTLVGLGGADALIGGDGIDLADYSVSTSGVTVSLQSGTGSGGDAEGDTLSGIENILGSASADRLTGAAGANVLTGGDGDDILAGLGGADQLVGGAGIDTADYSASSTGVTIDLGTGTVSGGDAQGDTLTSIENVTGSAQADRLTGAAGANVLTGGDGDDILAGLGGADQLIGGAGIDTADYSASSAGVTIDLGFGTGSGGDAQGDTLTSIENVTGSLLGDRLTGTAGANALTGGDGDDILAGLGGADQLVGGVGIDTADYSASGAGVVINLGTGVVSGGDAQGDILSDIENVTGSAQADTLVGGAGVNRLDGGDGDDILVGLGGADVLVGAAGVDTADYSASAAGVAVDLSAGTGVGGDAEGDTLTDVENIIGSAQADRLTGAATANVLTGGNGDDILAGLGGADALVGGAGIDLADYSASASGVTVDLGTGTGSGGDAAGDTLTDIENVTGSALADTLIGAAGVNVLAGGDGDDILA
ncbi:beta strand repeat-containing protein, partial [Rhizobiaceae sp. 2RAB30]